MYWCATMRRVLRPNPQPFVNRTKSVDFSCTPIQKVHSPGMKRHGPKNLWGFAPSPSFSFLYRIRNGNKKQWPSEQRYQQASQSISSTYESEKMYSKIVSSLKSYSVSFSWIGALLLKIPSCVLDLTLRWIGLNQML